MKGVAASVLFGAAAACFAVNLRTSPAWLFVLAAMVSIFWAATELRPGAVATLERVLQLFLTGTAILGWTLVTYPILSAQEVQTWGLRLGYPLGVVGSLFALTPRSLAPSAGVIPAAVGLLVVASFDMSAGTHGFLVVAGVAGFVYLAGDVSRLRGKRWLGRSLLVGAFGLTCAGIATCIVLILPWTQDRVQETLMSVYTPMSDGLDSAHQTRLGDLQRMKLSDKIVMRVWSERPQKLRARVFVRLDGAYWRRDPSSMHVLAPSEPAALGPGDREFIAALQGFDFVPMPERLEGRRLIRTKVVRVDGGGLATPGGSRLVHAPVETVRMDNTAIMLPPPRTPVRLYGVLHDVNHKRTQDGALEPADRELSLQLPENLDRRVAELAQLAASGASTPEATVEHVVAYLRENYEYSLDVGEIDRQDPLGDFLFENRRGWCEYFAGAAAILLRTQGVPTRYVEGFNVIGSQRKGDYYLVREMDRHAWIEAYIEGKGWLEYDPTPAAEYESLHAGLDSGVLSDAIEWVRLHVALVYVQLRHFEWSRLRGPFGWVLVFALAGYAVVRLARLRRSGKNVLRREVSAVVTGLEPLMRELDRRAAALGIPRRRSEAPLEYWSSAPDDVPAELRDAGVHIVESFYRARFGGARFTPEEIQSLATELTAASGE